MAQYGHLTRLDTAECRLLLQSRTFGRVGWNSVAGVQIMPVAYGIVDDLIVLRTQAGSPLAELIRPLEVSFQVDDLDGETSTGWSVLVHGTSGAAVLELPPNMPSPWAPGDGPFVCGSAIAHSAGRSVGAAGAVLRRGQPNSRRRQGAHHGQAGRRPSADPGRL